MTEAPHFQIKFSSDQDFDHLIGDVVYKDMGLCTLTLDGAGEKVLICFGAHEEIVSPFVDEIEISDFKKIIASAEAAYRDRMGIHEDDGSQG